MQNEKTNQGQRSEIIAWIEEYKAKWHGAKNLKYRFVKIEGNTIAQTNAKDGIIQLDEDYAWSNKDDFESTLIHEHFCHYYFVNFMGHKKMIKIYAMTHSRTDFKIFREKYLKDYPDSINNIESQMWKILGIPADKSDKDLSPCSNASIINEFFAYYVQEHYNEMLKNTYPNFLLRIGEIFYGPEEISKVDSLFIRPLRKYLHG